jgi:glyoxylase-like metal-dependent hydrolase (beta-lactamase superfamily II)
MCFIDLLICALNALRSAIPTEIPITLGSLLVCVAAVPCRAHDKVTILYDAFGESKELTMVWGFFALVEHNGKRVLFDTGNDAASLEHNVKALGIDLTKLDFVVISHRHADHTTGLRYVLRVNPKVMVADALKA